MHPEIYHIPEIDFELIIFEYIGDLESEGDHFLISPYRTIDEYIYI